MDYFLCVYCLNSCIVVADGQSTIRSTQRLGKMRGQTVELVGESRSATAREADDTEQLQRIVQMQKDEIRRLRESMEPRPTSAPRLPALASSTVA